MGEHGIWAGGDHALSPPCIREQQGVSDRGGTAQSVNMGIMLVVSEAVAKNIVEDDKGNIVEDDEGWHRHCWLIITAAPKALHQILGHQ